MQKWFCFLLVSLAAACGGPTPQPSPVTTASPAGSPVAGGASSPATTDPAKPAAGEGATATDGPATLLALRIEGPRGTPPGCLEVADMPTVLEWRIYNVPLDAYLEKGYSQDDEPGCAQTERHLRTQNDHLRWTRDPLEPTTLILQFDRDTYDGCRAQIDLSIDGVNVLGEVLNYGTDCAPPLVVPPPEPSSPIGCPQTSSISSVRGMLARLPDGRIRVDVSVQHENESGVWVVLYWRNVVDGREWIKGAWPVASPCDGRQHQDSFSWVSYDPAHLPENGARYFTVLATGPDAEHLSFTGPMSPL